MITIDTAENHEVDLSGLRQVQRIAGAIQGIYAFALVLICLALVLLLPFTGLSLFSPGRWLGIGFCFAMGVVTYFGLRLRKPWVVSLIVFGSASTLIPSIGSHPETVTAVITSRAGALFSLYQIVVLHSPSHNAIRRHQWDDPVLRRSGHVRAGHAASNIAVQPTRARFARPGG